MGLISYKGLQYRGVGEWGEPEYGGGVKCGERGKGGSERGDRKQKPSFRPRESACTVLFL